MNFWEFFEICKNGIVLGKPTDSVIVDWLFDFDEGSRCVYIAASQVSRLKSGTGAETRKKLKNMLAFAKKQDVVRYFHDCFFRGIVYREIGFKRPEEILLALEKFLESDLLTKEQKDYIRIYDRIDTLPELFVSLFYLAFLGELVALPPVLPANLPSGLHQRKLWISRETERKALQDLLATNEKEIFVVAEAGLGKTAFVVAFAHQEKENYQFCFTTYKDSLEDTICALNFKDWEPTKQDPKTNEAVRKTKEEVLQEKLALLQKYRPEDNLLLIIDNFDGDAETLLNDPLRDELRRMDIRILYTTRMPMIGKPCVFIKPFTGMQFEPLIKFYLGEHYPQEVQKIISLVENNTLLVDLCVRLIATSEERDILQTIIKALKSKKWNHMKGCVTGTENDREGTLLKHLLNLFDVSTGLTEEAKRILSCATLLPTEGFDSGLFRRCIMGETADGEEADNEEAEKAFSSLRRSGWLKFDKERYCIYLHPLMQTAFSYNEKVKPTWERCLAFLEEAIELSSDFNASYVVDQQFLALFEIALKNMQLDGAYWQEYSDLTFQMGMLWAKSGLFDIAAQYIKYSLSLLDDEPDETAEKAQRQWVLANIYSCNGQNDEADAIYQHLENVLKDYEVVGCSRSSLYAAWASLAEKEGIRNKAIDWSEQALDLLRKDKAAIPEDIYTCYDTAIKISLDSQQVYAYIKDMLKALSDCPEKDLEVLVYAYTTASEACIVKEDYKKAIDYANLALEEAKKQGEDRVLAEAKEIMAKALSQNRQFQEALDYQQQALKIYTEVLAKFDPELAIAHIRVGEYALWGRNIDLAKEHIAEGKRIFAKTNCADPVISHRIQRIEDYIAEIEQK